jgi:hypothetical protein
VRNVTLMQENEDDGGVRCGLEKVRLNCLKGHLEGKCSFQTPPKSQSHGDIEAKSIT